MTTFEGTELWMIVCMLLGGGLFALGGTGFKWARRFVLPALLAIIAAINGFAWLTCVGYAITQSVTFCLPYGERTPYPVKFLVFCSYALPSLFFGFTWWQPILALGCFLLFVLSNWKPTAQTFLWKIVEFLFGSLVGITIASLIAKHAGG